MFSKSSEGTQLYRKLGSMIPSCLPRPGRACRNSFPYTTKTLSKHLTTHISYAERSDKWTG